MARGRMLNNSICASLKLHHLPDDTCRLMATWLISHLDYRGVFYADPAMVKSIVFPRRADITLDQVATYLGAMEKAGLIRRFQAGGDTWQHWPGFEHNQIGLRADRERTAYPPPDGRVKVPTPPPAVPHDDGSKPEAIRQESGKVPAEENRTEVKENRTEEPATPAQAPAPTPPTPKPRRKSQKKPRTPTPPAIRVFRENAHRYPARSWYDDVAQAVGDDPGDLELWGQVVKGYVGQGWNPTNVANMLEFYQRREIPSNDKGKTNAHSTRNRPAGFVGGTARDHNDPTPEEIADFQAAVDDARARRRREQAASAPG